MVDLLTTSNLLFEIDLKTRGQKKHNLWKKKIVDTLDFVKIKTSPVKYIFEKKKRHITDWGKYL